MKSLGRERWPGAGGCPEEGVGKLPKVTPPSLRAGATGAQGAAVGEAQTTAGSGPRAGESRLLKAEESRFRTNERQHGILSRKGC